MTRTRRRTLQTLRQHLTLFTLLVLIVGSFPVLGQQGQQPPATPDGHKRSPEKVPPSVPALRSGVVVSIPLSFSLEEAASGKIEHPTFSRGTLTVRLQNGATIEASATKDQMEAALKGNTKALLKKVSSTRWKVVSLEEPTPKVVQKIARETLTDSRIVGRMLEWGLKTPAKNIPLQLAEVKELNGTLGIAFSEKTNGLSTATDSEGKFVFRNVPPGKWAITVNLNAVRTSEGTMIVAEVTDGAFVVIELGDILLR